MVNNSVLVRLITHYSTKSYNFIVCLRAVMICMAVCLFCLCWGLTSKSTIFQSCRDGATASWVINQYFRGVKCLAQGHNTAAVGIEPPTSRSGVRCMTESTCREVVTNLLKYIYFYDSVYESLFSFAFSLVLNMIFKLKLKEWKKKSNKIQKTAMTIWFDPATNLIYAARRCFRKLRNKNRK